MGSVLLYGFETWPLRVEYTQIISLFENRRPFVTGRMWWEIFMVNSEVRLKVLGPRVKSSEQATNQNKLRWFLTYFAFVRRKATSFYVVLLDR